MNVLFIVLGAGVIFVIAYLTYGKFLAKKVFQLDDKNKTPAVEINDGNDFVPAKKGMLMGQHFSAIAAAGPINGPIIAGVMFGWAPALFWIIIGSIFIGGVHDMGALVASVRHKARSITEVIRVNVSKRAWIIFMLFIWITLVYIIVAFTDLTAGSFVGMVTLENGDKVMGGSIAASSLLYLLLPVVMGLLIRYAKLSEKLALIIFLPLVGAAIWVGRYIPIAIPGIDPTNIIASQKAWSVIILVYCVIASVVPVWALLQPRGALGGYFLYAALITGAIGIIFGGYKIEYPAFTKLAMDGSMGSGFWFPMMPLLFTTIACGACSGFHSLVSSGTTSKQLEKESDAKPVGYGAMLLEGMVAIVSLACVMIVTKDNPLIAKAPNFIYASGIGRFLELIGIPASYGVSFGLLAFTTFVYDTLDVCTRLGRYIFEELTGMKNWVGRAIGTLATAFVPLIFIFQTMEVGGKPVPAWKAFWNTFGGSNQLLAALALIGVTVWLLKTAKNKKVWLVSFIPAVFMFTISNWSLLDSIITKWGNPTAKAALSIHPAVPWINLILVILSVLVAIETAVALLSKKPANADPSSGNDPKVAKVC
ncbi:MAG TPA: carbon starvation CstA family protein [Rectinemataceae bacterium]|nr:carbon starvation CstA family protein [Rectinemataceae bacterium]